MVCVVEFVWGEWSPDDDEGDDDGREMEECLREGRRGRGGKRNRR